MSQTVPAMPVRNAASAVDYELRRSDVLHSVSKAGVSETDFGTREFATVDLDGNLVTFFQWASK